MASERGTTGPDEPATHFSAQSHPRQWAIFSQLDADGSGTLDIDEIYTYLADMCVYCHQTTSYLEVWVACDGDH